MKNSSPNIDGFVIPRRTNGGSSDRRPGLDDMGLPSQYMLNPADKKTTSEFDAAGGLTNKDRRKQLGAAAADKAMKESTTSSDLGTIDISLPDEKNGKRDKKKRGKWSRKKIIRLIVVIFILAVLGLAGFFAWKIFSNASRIFHGNIFNAVISNQPLKKDQYGRTNVLIFGTSEDDPGHDGAQLTDSIMIASVDQSKKNAFLVSVPRDLWVKFGQTCSSGTEGKINEVYLCGKGSSNNEDAGETALRNMVGQTFGIDLQYSVHIDYTVVREAVDAVGGVDITIDSKDPRGILDRNFDWRCNYKCYLVKYPNGPAHLDGEHALFLAQARNDAGGYGLPQGNFDREANQRKILIALKEKATSAGFLANPISVTNLLDSLGNNVRTNIDAAEFKSFASLAKDINANNIRSLNLVDPANPLMTTGQSPGGASIVKPSAGLYEYADLQAYVLANLKGDGPVLDEKAPVDVLNQTNTAGLAQKEADKLKAEGITIGAVDGAPAGTTTAKYALYDLSGGKKPATKQKLEQVLGIKTTGTTLPAGITSKSDFVIIVNTDGVN